MDPGPIARSGSPRAIAALLLVGTLLAGCSGHAGTTVSSSTEPAAAPGGNPLVQVVKPKVVPALHLLQAPAVSWNDVPAGDPVRSPFNNAAPTGGSFSPGQTSVEWTWTVDKPLKLAGTGNWTVWVEVPSGAYQTVSCAWEFSLEVRSNRSSGSFGSSPDGACSQGPGPATAGVLRLDGREESSFLKGMKLVKGDTVTLSVSCTLVVPPTGSPVVALSGAKGRDSQLVLETAT